MTHRIIPVIMSGGSGTRLWPVSRQQKPKQLLPLVTDRTMLQETAARVGGAADGVEFLRPMLVANAAHLDDLVGQLDDLGMAPMAVALEPVGKNTAPIASVAAALAEENGEGEALLLMLPADHHIRDVEGFRATLAKGAKLAADGALVTFGIQPDAPETGYGYIRRGAALGDGYDVAEFVEKPNRETAQAYLDTGEYYWNAGIFMFRADRVLSEMDRHCPKIRAQSVEAVRKGKRDGVVVRLDPAAFGECPSDSFDYAVMENTDSAAVVPADIGWSDVGSWAALWELADRDANGNAMAGHVTTVDCRNVYVRTDGPKVAVIGADDLVVVVTGDAVLVSHRNEVQNVKAVVNALKDSGRHDLL